MASVPPGAFAARKVHDNIEKDQKLPVSVFRSTKLMPQYPQMTGKFLEQPPVQYNSKLMNSIWGLYNRYSVHNLKKITDGKSSFVLGAKQCVGSAEASLQGW